MTAPSYSFVGIKRCGCATSAILGDLATEEEIEAFCESAENAGMQVERKDSEWVKENFGYCAEHKPAVQKELF